MEQEAKPKKWLPIVASLAVGIVCGFVLGKCWPGPVPEMVPASISGTVWQDTTANATTNPHQTCTIPPGAGLPSVTVRFDINYDGIPGYDKTTYATTGPDGSYQLGPGITPGAYRIRAVLATPLTNWCDYDDPAAAGSVAADNVVEFTVPKTGYQDKTGVTFGFK